MDVMQREGHYPPPKGSSDILGVEFSGVVSEIGSDVTRFAVGDHVFGLVGGVSPRSPVDYMRLELLLYTRVLMQNMSPYMSRMSGKSLNISLGFKLRAFRRSGSQVFKSPSQCKPVHDLR